MSEICIRVDLGLVDYLETWELQRRLAARRQAREIPDALLFVEHPPTYTLGRGGILEHLLLDPEELSRLGARFVQTDRGGDITFHGPGQIVGYPILDLQPLGRDVHFYLRRLEEVLIRALVRFGIEAERIPGLTGVWHREGKLAAIGVRVARWVTSHGFALNVSTDLGYFDHIVPCGIVGGRVASMENVLGRAVDRRRVRDALSAEFGFVFDRQILVLPSAQLEHVGERAELPAPRNGTRAETRPPRNPAGKGGAPGEKSRASTSREEPSAVGEPRRRRSDRTGGAASVPPAKERRDFGEPRRSRRRRRGGPGPQEISSRAHTTGNAHAGKATAS